MIATIKLKTKQGAFNRAYRGVIAQGIPSVRPGSASLCRYYGGEGIACGVGHLIDNAEDRQHLDTRDCTGIGSLMDVGDVSTTLDKKILRELQDAHDDAANVIDWKRLGGSAFIAEFRENMARLAERHGLTIPRDVA